MYTVSWMSDVEFENDQSIYNNWWHFIKQYRGKGFVFVKGL